MGARARVLVTRPAGQSDALLAALESRGFTAEHLPMLAIEPIDPLPGAQRQRLLDLDRYDHLIFISANAARIGLERIDEFWPQLPLGQRYWAVGASTAAVLADAGLAAESPPGDMSSEGLLAMPGLAAPQGQRVLLVKGEGGRELLERALRARGAEVDTLCCYRRGPAGNDPRRVQALLAGPGIDIILISSGEGLALLSGLLQPRERTNLADTALLVVPSPRVATQAQELGWQHIVCAENASDDAMLAAIADRREAQLGEKQH
jgi:uroporphyrinogen-III synthase